MAALGLLVLAALSGGCQVVPAHHADGPYYLHDGMWCGTFDIGFEEARVAVRGALAELRMPISQEGPERRGAFLDTRTPDDFEARVVILPPNRRAERTRICIRVGGFGTHRQVCERLLDAIARHVDAERHRYSVPAAPVPPPVAAPHLPPGSAGPPPDAPAGPPPDAHGSEPALPPQPVPVGPQ
jgi:hypothetical protein